MTRPTLRRGAAFTAAGALLAGLAVAAPMAASGVTTAPVVAFIDTTVPSAAALSSLPPDGVAVAPTLLNPTGLQTSFFAASSDTATADTTVVTGVRTVGSVLADTTSALVITHGGVSKVLSTFTDVNPVVSADGSTVWFLVRGNLYKYAVTGLGAGTTTQINGAAQFNPWAAAAGSHSYIYRLAVSTDGSKAAELLQSYPNSGGGGVNRSQIRVFDISQTGANFVTAPIWTSFNYTGNTLADPQLLPYNFVFTDNKTLVTGECVNDPCDTWTTFSVDTTTATSGVKVDPGITALPNLDNLLGLRQSAGTWTAWNLDIHTAHTVTPNTTTDPTFATALTHGTAWPVGSDKYFAYITPLADTAPVFSALTPKMGVAPTLTLSAKVVPTGSRVHFNAFGTYPSPASGQILQKETATVGRGTLQYSITNGATWATFATTTSGGGSTQKLTRNTRFRWVYAGDVLTNHVTSGTPLVYVTPSLSVKVTRSGTNRIVAGVTSRVGGSVALYKLSGRTWKKLFTTPVKAKGAYSFGKRHLVKGTYRVVSSADVSWPSNIKVFRVA